MHTSKHPVEPAFAVDDLNSLLSKHHNLISSYDFIFNSIDSKPILEVCSGVRQSHTFCAQRLREWILQNGGSVVDSSDAVAAVKNMRILVSTRLSSGPDLVEEMRDQERALIDDYARNINNLTRMDGLEATLLTNMDDAEVREQALTRFLIH